MARIILTAPQPSIFHTQLTIQIGDLNYGNHLSNDAVLRMVHEARIRWLASGGFGELDCGGVGIIMADAAIMYKNQGFHGDVLNLDVSIGEIGSSNFELYTTITRQSDSKLIAIVKNGIVCFDYQAQKVAKIPEVFYQFMQDKA